MTKVCPSKGRTGIRAELPLTSEVSKPSIATLRYRGGIKYFASDPKAVAKWTLNRAAQAKNTEALYNLAGIKESGDFYKLNRPLQIIKSEVRVAKICKVLKKEYINPFDPSTDAKLLFNLSSGVPVEPEVADSIIGLKVLGVKLYGEFVDTRIKSSAQKIHAPIKRQNLSSFRSASKTVTMKTPLKNLTVEVNRNILAKLLAYSAKAERAIDFEKALEYPLCPVPLSLANPDGSRRMTSKSQLTQILLSYCDKSPEDSRLPCETSSSAYLVDLLALIRTISGCFETYRHLAAAIVDMLPTGYARIDIVADTYRDNSLKDTERTKRGTSSKILIQSASSKIPKDFNEFLKNGENKTRLVEVVKDELVENKRQICQKLNCQKIFFSMDGICLEIQPTSVDIRQKLCSNQEEADTKLLLHAKHAFDEDKVDRVVVRSPSGDVDINVLFLAMFNINTDIWIDFGNGKSRKRIQLNSIDMSEERKRALIGFHAFTGNDYVSSFFRKSKKTCWKLVEKTTDLRRPLHGSVYLGILMKHCY